MVAISKGRLDFEGVMEYNSLWTICVAIYLILIGIFGEKKRVVSFIGLPLAITLLAYIVAYPIMNFEESSLTEGITGVHLISYVVYLFICYFVYRWAKFSWETIKVDDSQEDSD